MREVRRRLSAPRLMPDHHVDRHARARDAMSVAGFDALLLIGSSNVTYLSGYPYVDTNLARPFFLIVPASGDPVMLVHEGRQYEARALSGIDDVRVYHALSVAPIDELGKILADLDLSSGVIGAELGFEQRMGLPIAEFSRLRDGIMPARVLDAADLLWGLRMLKSDAEIASIRRACAITASAYERTFADARGGMTEDDVRRLMVKNLLDLGGGSPYAVATSGPGNYDVVCGAGSDRRLEVGDMVWLDSGCTVNGLWSDFGRGAVVGQPTSAQVEAQAAIHSITADAAAMVAPGVALSDIARFCNRSVEELKLPITSNISGIAGRVGHGIGMDPTEPPHLSEVDQTTLEAGMVITVEPGVATADGIYHVEEDVLCTPDGYEVLSECPRELFELPPGG